MHLMSPLEALKQFPSIWIDPKCRNDRLLVLLSGAYFTIYFDSECLLVAKAILVEEVAFVLCFLILRVDIVTRFKRMVFKCERYVPQLHS